MLYIEVWQDCERTNLCIAQVAAVVDGGVVIGVAYVLHDDRVARCSRAAKNGADDKYAVSFLKHIRELLELVAVLELVYGYAADIGTAYKSDVHLCVELIF